MSGESLLETLETSLRQMRSAKKRLAERLEQVEVEIEKREQEARDLRSEVEALESSAVKTEEAIKSLINLKPSEK